MHSIAAVFVVSLIDCNLTVLFLSGIEQKWVSAMYQQINIAIYFIQKMFVWIKTSVV